VACDRFGRRSGRRRRLRFTRKNMPGAPNDCSGATKNGRPASLTYLWLGSLLVLTIAAQTADEYQVKAACLYNLAKFVEWPATTFRNEKEPIHICLLGQNSFGSLLGETMGGKTVSGRAFAVRAIADPAGAGNCQILFVSSLEKNRLQSAVAETHAAGVLTVGESEGFAAQGGIVNLKIEDGRLRIEINPDAAREAKLRISSQLLSLAQIVKGKDPK
jgi:hypothetical protein